MVAQERSGNGGREIGMNVLAPGAMRSSVVACLLMVSAGLLAWAATPRTKMNQDASLAQAIPSQFGDWKELKTGLTQTSLSTNTQGGLTEEQPYDEVLMRTYANSKGEQVMLALAYAREQRQEVKIHRPEVCYTAQGYKPLDERDVEMPQTGGRSGVLGKRLLMGSSYRTEAVSYWIRMGSAYPQSGAGARMAILQYGLKGIVPDAVLVRASSIVAKPQEASSAFRRQERFLAELVQAMTAADASLLVAAK
jgi:EpsI family protein